MCGKPLSDGFRTVSHSDRGCRAVFGLQTPCLRRRQRPDDNQVFPDSPATRDPKRSRTAFWRISATARSPRSHSVCLCVPGGRFVRSGPLNQLTPAKANVRKTGGNDAIEELAASIAAHGLLTSLDVRKAARGRYTVIAGQRR